MVEFSTKIYQYKCIEYLDENCIKDILYLQQNISYDIEDFLPQGNIGNIIIITYTYDNPIGYTYGEIKSDKNGRNCWIYPVSYTLLPKWIKEMNLTTIMKYFTDNIMKIKKKNIYLSSNINIPHAIYKIGTRHIYKIINNDDKDNDDSVDNVDNDDDVITYAIPMYDSLDNEIKVLNTLTGIDKILFVIISGYKLEEELEKDEIIECLENTVYLNKYSAQKILHNVYKNNELYETIYCILSYIIYRPDKIRTLDEIVYHNELIEINRMVPSFQNEVIKAYGLNDMNNYYMRIVKNLEVKTYEKKDYIKIIKKCLEINDLVLGVDNKTMIVRKTFQIISYNIICMLEHTHFMNVVKQKVDEFYSSYCYHSGRILQNDFIAEIYWLKLKKTD